jgi:hypothetical protein
MEDVEYVAGPISALDILLARSADGMLLGKKGIKKPRFT